MFHGYPEDVPTNSNFTNVFRDLFQTAFNQMDFCDFGLSVGATSTTDEQVNILLSAQHLPHIWMYKTIGPYKSLILQNDDLFSVYDEMEQACGLVAKFCLEKVKDVLRFVFGIGGVSLFIVWDFLGSALQPEAMPFNS